MSESRSRAASGRRIGYLMSRFPHLSETFILREMQALERAGWDVRLYPLILQRQEVVHAEAKPWMQRARDLSRGVVAANAAELARRPRAWAGMWLRTAWEYRRAPSALVRALVLLPRCVLAARLMRADGVAHVHAHYATYPALAAWVAHQLDGVSYSVTVHAHDLFTTSPMLATKLGEAEMVVAISEYNRDFLARTVGPEVADQTEVVHCGVDAEAYRQSARPPNDRIDLLSVGSLQAYKGHEHLIEACALLVERGLDVRCRIVGAGAREPLLRRAIAARGLGDVVELLGPKPQDEVAELLATASCYVQPSVVAPDGQMEGIPVALMEAMASGLPAVASGLSGIPELVHPGRTGWLVPPASPKAIADAVDEIASHPEETARVAAAGAALVTEEFDLERNVERLAALFARLVPSQTPAGDRQ